MPVLDAELEEPEDATLMLELMVDVWLELVPLVVNVLVTEMP